MRHSEVHVLLLVLLVRGTSAMDHQHHHHQATNVDDSDMAEGSGDSIEDFFSDDEDFTIDDSVLLRTRLNRTAELLPTSASGPWAIVLHSNEPLDYAMTFDKNISYAHSSLSNFALCPGYELSFSFRSDKPHGLLTFLKQNSGETNDREHHFVFLRHGAIAVRLVTNDYRDTFVSSIGGLQDNEWHTVRVTTACDSGTVTVTVDDTEEVFSDYRFKRSMGSGYLDLWLGGVVESKSEPSLLAIHQFRGCLRSVQLKQQSSGEDALATQELVVTDEKGVTSSLTCSDPCLGQNQCPADARCINHYSHATCDCSKISASGPHCKTPDDHVLSLHGDGYLQHALYDWRDMAHTTALSVEFSFRTNTSDALLMLASTERPTLQHLSLTIDSAGVLRAGGTLPNFEENLHITVNGVAQDSHGKLIDAMQITPRVDDLTFHHVKISFTTEKNAKIIWNPDIYFGDSPHLKQVCHQPGSAGDLQCLREDQAEERTIYYFDPASNGCLSHEYSGCGGGENRFSSVQQCEKECSVPGLVSRLPFVGCMRGVYVNGVSVLGSLGLPGTTYTGQRDDASNICHEDHAQVLSLTTPRSAVPLPSSTDSPSNSLSFALNFRLSAVGGGVNSSQGVLANGKVLMSGTVDQWMVYSDGEFLHYKLRNDLINLKSAAAIDKNGFNKLVVHQSPSASGTTISLTLNDKPVSTGSEIAMQFVSGVTLGAEMAALRTCFRDVLVDGNRQDLRRFLNRESGVVFDGCQMEGPCELAETTCLHKGKCTVGQAGASCDCSGTDYEGNRCQFAKYPTSCAEYRRHGFNSTGRYKIDFDGPGPMKAFPVICHFGEEDTTTEFLHNIPDSFVVRKSGMKTHRLVVNYEDLWNDQLASIVDSSSSCSQAISFNCTRARLRLSGETWFSSPRNDMFSHFGTDSPAICPCKADDKCVKPGIPCNCDANDGLMRTDSAEITNKRHLPVTALHFIMDQMSMDQKSMSKLTLGNLVCSKEDEPEDAVSLLNTNGFLELLNTQRGEDRLQHLHSIGFAFRTSASSGTLLHKPAVLARHADFRFILVKANHLEFQYRHKSRLQTVSFHTHYRLNVAAWQNIWIDFCHSEIRVILNGHPKFIDLKNVDEVFEGDMYLGGTPSDLVGSIYPDPKTPGLIGCFKDFRVNHERISVTDLIKRSPSQSYNMGCQLSCDPNPCHNGASCLERSEGQYECQCKNEYAHSGKNCNSNLNHNSVTFMNTDTEMRYKNEQATPINEFNPLIKNITFGFRTRAFQALLLFTKDHLQNLIQIYMAKPNEVSLIWNTGYVLQTLTINTDDVVLNEGELVQIHLERTRSSTKFHLQTGGIKFVEELEEGVKLMTENEYQQFPFGAEVPHPELTLYLQKENLPTPSMALHLGGASSGDLHAKVPGLVGCLSGFKVGHRHIKLEDRSIWTWNQLTYEIGCYSACADNNLCRNGGVCKSVFDNGKEDGTQCGCEKTSYLGSKCDQEIAFDFNGGDALVFKKKYALFREPFSLDFAISVSAPHPESDGTEMMLLIRDVPDLADVIASRSQQRETLAVGLQMSPKKLVIIKHLPDIEQDITLSGNLQDMEIEDGYRYHFIIEVNGEQISVKINGEQLPLEESIPDTGSWPHSEDFLVVGGVADPDTLGDSVASWDNFHGCISNVQFRTRSKKVFRPLKDYDINVEDLVSYERIGLPNRTTCSSFQNMSSMTIAHNHGAYQEPSLRGMASPQEPLREDFQPIQMEVKEINDGSGMRTAGKIGLFIMVAVCIFVVVYLCKLPKKSPDETKTSGAKEYEMVDIEDKQGAGSKDRSETEVGYVPSAGEGASV